MKSFLKTVGPILGLALIMTAIAQFASPVKADQSSLAERLQAINAQREQQPKSVKAAAVIFSAAEQYLDGYYVYEFQASSNAPKPPNALDMDPAELQEFYLARGFVVQSSDGFVFRMIRLPSQDQIVKD